MLAPNISNVGYNAHLINKTYGTSNSTKSTAIGNNNADGDAAVEINQNPLRADTAEIQQNVHNGNAMFSLVQVLKDSLADIEEKMDKMRDPVGKTFSQKMTPLVKSPEEIMAAMEEIVAQMKELWEVEMSSGSDVEKNIANLNLTL